MLLFNDPKFAATSLSAVYIIQRDPVPEATKAPDPELLSKSPPDAITIVLLSPVAVKVTPELIVTAPLDVVANNVIFPATVELAAKIILLDPASIL